MSLSGFFQTRSKKQGLTGAVVIVFFGHMKPPVCSKEQAPLRTGFQTTLFAYFRAAPQKHLQKIKGQALKGLALGRSGIIGFHGITNNKNGIRAVGNQYFHQY